MVFARQEGEAADDIPVRVDPVGDRDPFIVADGDGHRRIMLGVIDLDHLPVLELLESREVVLEDRCRSEP